MPGEISSPHDRHGNRSVHTLARLMQEVEAAPDPKRAVSMICAGVTELWPVSSCWIALPQREPPGLIAPACLRSLGCEAEPMAFDEPPDACGDCSLVAHCGTGPRAVIPLGETKGRPGVALLCGDDPISPSTLEDASTILRWLTHAVAHRASSGSTKAPESSDSPEQRRELEEALDEARADHRESEALAKAARGIPGCENFEKAARHVFDCCRELLGADAGYVAMLSADGKNNEVLFLEPGGLLCTVDPNLPMPIRGLRSEVYASGEVMTENAFNKSAYREMLPEGHVDLRSVLFAPIQIDDDAVGVIGMANKPGGFTPDDQRVAGLFADLAALALRSALDREDLVRSETRLRHLYNAIGDMVFVSDPDGRIRDVNSAVLDQLGYALDELKSLRMADLAAPRYAEAALDRPDEISVRGDHSFESCLVTRDGKEIPVHCRVRVFSLEGETYSLGIARDISEHKRAIDDLRQAQKMEAVGRLASGVAHDFNNLLSAILVCTDMLLGELPDDGWVHEEVTVIRKAATSASDLTRKLLVFGSKQILRAERFGLGRLVAESIPMLRRAIPENIILEHKRAPVSLPIRADRNQIEQVLVNLVLNARDAMPEGGTLVIQTLPAQVEDPSANTAQNPPPGSCAILRVSDDGVGMDAETQKRIFDPFFTTKPRGQGTGLGLSSVFGIVRTHQGSVTVDSQPGKGSRFTVVLPLCGHTVGRQPTAKEAVAPRGSGERVLLVEDNDMVRKVAYLLLNRLGYQVHQAADGAEALVLLEGLDVKPDLVITDLIMPNMSGSELVSKIHVRHPEMKVMFMTGHGEEHSGSLAEEHRGIEIVRKPFNRAEFASRVHRVLHD